MRKVRFLGVLILGLVGMSAAVNEVDAGVLKGYVYEANGTLAKNASISITIKDTATPAETIGAGNAAADGSILVSFDSSKIEADKLIVVEFKRGGNTVIIPKEAKLIGTAVTHTLHVVVINLP